MPGGDHIHCSSANGQQSSFESYLESFILLHMFDFCYDP